jgi:hypothetical protein
MFQRNQSLNYSLSLSLSLSLFLHFKMSDKRQRQMFNKLITGSGVKGGKVPSKRSTAVAEREGSRKLARTSREFEGSENNPMDRSNIEGREPQRSELVERSVPMNVEGTQNALIDVEGPRNIVPEVDVSQRNAPGVEVSRRDTPEVGVPQRSAPEGQQSRRVSINLEDIRSLPSNPAIVVEPRTSSAYEVLST